MYDLPLVSNCFSSVIGNPVCSLKGIKAINFHVVFFLSVINSPDQGFYIFFVGTKCVS